MRKRFRKEIQKHTCKRCIIWSWISETRGEITNVIPGQIRAGSCKKKKKKNCVRHIIKTWAHGTLFKILDTVSEKKRFNQLEDVISRICVNLLASADTRLTIKYRWYINKMNNKAMIIQAHILINGSIWILLHLKRVRPKASTKGEWPKVS